MTEISGRTANRDVVGMGGLTLERKKGRQLPQGGALKCGRGGGRDKRG